MNIPPSEHFSTLSLISVFNATRNDLPDPLRPPDSGQYGYGKQSFLGIPFELGNPDGENVLFLDRDPVIIDFSMRATYLIFLHVAGDRLGGTPGEFTTSLPEPGGNDLGSHISDYSLEYDDRKTASTPILRRFAIQQSRVHWGASPFEAVPALSSQIFRTASEAHSLGEVSIWHWGDGESRTFSARDWATDQLWLYALQNPYPEKVIRRLILRPQTENSVIYAISHTRSQSHPLQTGLRRKLRLAMPSGTKLNVLDEVDEIDVDLGSVISARAAYRYEHDQWEGSGLEIQPELDRDNLIVNYVAHPLAKLYLASGPQEFSVYDLSRPNPMIEVIPPTDRLVRLRVVERGSSQPVPVRLHLHGESGEYLPPRGHQRKVNAYWLEDYYADFVNDRNQYSYIPGECEVDLPLGDVFVEISRGYEVTPIRQSVHIAPDTAEITLELDRPVRWREAGWVTADTHVHILSPQTALLEGAAEGVNVVNLLATQWGERYTNIGDFDGRTLMGAKELGGEGEFILRVGTENRMQVLGHISLLGYEPPMIHPLTTGGPSESAVGDPVEVAMAEWAEQCIRQNGLVVMPHAPDPQCERAADIVLGLVHAVEMMTFNPYNWQIRAEGLFDWYRYLNLGYLLPIVGGSDKMSAAHMLGGVRTYTHLGARSFTYADWKNSVRTGNTFVTVGPLVELQVGGRPPGTTLTLPASGGSVDVEWKVESVRCPATSLEVVRGGLTVEEITLPADIAGLMRASGTLQVQVDQSTWIAARVRGSYRNRAGDIAAHTSAVQVLVGENPLWSEPDAKAVLAQIEGALAYVDTLAQRPHPDRFERLRAVLASAHELMHRRISEPTNHLP